MKKSYHEINQPHNPKNLIRECCRKKNWIELFSSYKWEYCWRLINSILVKIFLKLHRIHIMLLVCTNTDEWARLNMKINSRAYFFFATSSKNFVLMMSHSFYLSIVTRDSILINGKIWKKRDVKTRKRDVAQ